LGDIPHVSLALPLYIYIAYSAHLVCLKINCGKVRAVCFPSGARVFRRKWAGMPTCASFLLQHLLLIVNSWTCSQRIFEALGFRLDEVLASSKGDTSPALLPPNTLSATPEGIQNRAKLLRAWVEISAWLVDYLRRQGRNSQSFFCSLDADLSQLLP
jgi:hypothetical protein